MTQRKRERLQRIRGELVLIVQHVVVGRARRSQQRIYPNEIVSVKASLEREVKVLIHCGSADRSRTLSGG